MAGYGRGAIRGAAGGMSNLARSLLAGPAIEQQAGMQEAMGQSRIAQALAAAQKDQADADLLGTKNDMLARRPDMLEEQAALMAGANLPLVRAVRESVRSGRPAQIEMAGPTEDGSPLMGDIPAEQRTAIGQALLRLAPLSTNTGDFKADDWAKALGIFSDQDLRGEVLSGRRDAKSVALAQRAMKGEAAYAPAEYGVTDLFSGTVDATGAPAQRFGQYRDSTTAAQKANAAQSYAAAGASNALRDQRKAAVPAQAAQGAAPAADDRRTLAGSLGVPLAERDPFAGMSEKSAEIFKRSLYKDAEKRLTDVAEAAASAQSMARDVKQFLELQQGVSMQGPVAGRVPAFTSDAQTMDAITARITPQMRQPGSGATSDFDARMFQMATVSRTKNDEANAAIGNAVILQAENAMAREQFMRDYLSVNGHLDGADRQWKRYIDANPIFDPKSGNVPKLNPARVPYQQFFGSGAAPAQPAPGRTASPAAEALTPAEQAELEQLRARFNKGR